MMVAVAVAVPLLAVATPVAAQTDATGTRTGQTWVAGGFGAGVSTDEAKAMVSLELAHATGEHLFMFAVGGAFELYGESLGDFGVLYRRSRSSESFHTHAAAGLSVTESDSESGVGVPLRLGASWRPVPILGIGVRTLANVSTVGSYVGFAIVLELGDLR